MGILHTNCFNTTNININNGSRHNSQVNCGCIDLDCCPESSIEPFSMEEIEQAIDKVIANEACNFPGPTSAFFAAMTQSFLCSFFNLPIIATPIVEELEEDVIHSMS